MSFLTERLFQVLESHPLYQLLTNANALGYFLERHVICAWSYGQILHSLQKDMVAAAFPLRSDGHKEALHLISELVMQEEVCASPAGRYFSNFELYLEAMQDLKCDVTPMLCFLDFLEHGVPAATAIEQSQFAPEIVTYARHTLHLLSKPVHARAAALFYEGEPFIPDRFLYQLHFMLPNFPVAKILEYFEGHIEGLKRPDFSAARRLVEVFCQNDFRLNREAEQAAETALAQRLDLWNTLVLGITSGEAESCSYPAPELLVHHRGHLRLVVSNG